MVKQAGQGTALLYMSFNSDMLTPAQITDYITRVVQPRLQTIDGVASAQILGGQNFAMRVWLDPDKMAARGVTAVGHPQRPCWPIISPPPPARSRATSPRPASTP